MKKLLSMLSILTLASTSIGTTISTDVNNITKTSNKNSKYAYQEKHINSPIGNNSFLTTAGDGGTERREWAYITINLGNMKQEQIMGIRSTYNDSYTEHKVPSYSYHKKDDNAGINHGPNFRNYFFQDKVTPNWIFNIAINKANLNFTSRAKWGWAQHWASGTIKFLWHYNSNSELLIQIVGTLYVSADWSTVEGVGSIKLGRSFTIFYT